jgi:hypothetical protein
MNTIRLQGCDSLRKTRPRVIHLRGYCIGADLDLHVVIHNKAILFWVYYFKMEGSPACSKGVLSFDSFTMQKLYSNFLLVFFPRVTPEPGLQCHVSFEAELCHVLIRPSPEQHDLRLLRKALFPGRY